MRYKVDRVIWEIVKEHPYPTIREISVNLAPANLISAGIEPDEQDNEDELYGNYELTFEQLMKIQDGMKTDLKIDLKIDFDKYLYVLSCFQSE